MAKATKYALSITMKYGEVLHLEGLGLEEKNRYFQLAKEESSVVVETRDSVRRINGSDIATVTAVAYDNTYESTVHMVKKMLFSESTLGTGILKLFVRLFLLAVLMFVASGLVKEVADGTIMTTAMEDGKLLNLLLTSWKTANRYFVPVAAMMFVISMVDVLLGLNASYYINQDGAEPVRQPRYRGLMYTVGFVFLYNMVMMLIGA